MPRPGHEAALAFDTGRFAALWERLRLRGAPGDVLEALTRAYGERGRSYHTAAHVADCLEQLDLEPGAAARPDEVEFALMFHDAVYDPRASDNEARSAAWAAEVLRCGNAPGEVQERVRVLVLVTRHDGPAPRHPDARVIADVDLSILGRDPVGFAEFERRIREEYAWMPPSDYCRGRRAVLASFLARTPIYHVEGYRRRYEAQARRNLEATVAALTKPSS